MAPISSMHRAKHQRSFALALTMHKKKSFKPVITTQCSFNGHDGCENNQTDKETQEDLHKRLFDLENKYLNKMQQYEDLKDLTKTFYWECTRLLKTNSAINNYTFHAFNQNNSMEDNAHTLEMHSNFELSVGLNKIIKEIEEIVQNNKNC